MKVIAIADDDSMVGKLPTGSVDLLLCLGDLWDTTIEAAYLRYQPTRTFAVKGNHDSASEFPPFVTPLHFTLKKHLGLSFGGFGGSWRYKPKGHHLFEQHDVKRMLQSFPRVDVFIAHNSPRGIHERDDHTHQGFDGFLAYILANQPRLFIHGHQHVNQITRIGKTEVVSVFGEMSLEI